MAIPQGSFIIRNQISGTKPDSLERCNHSIYHADRKPVCIKCLWELSISVNRKGHRVTIDEEQNKALIFTTSGAYWVTIPITTNLPTVYKPGIFATVKPEIADV